MSQQEIAGAAGKKHPAIHIEIDSHTYTVFDEDWQADALLRLAGLDPAQYDLARVKKKKLDRFQDQQVVDVHEGDEFESVRQDGPVA